MRRFGEAVKSGQKYTIRPGAYAILPKWGGLLCTLERLEDWEVQLPGGGIDPGENPIAALHREVFEETGWKIATPRKVGTYTRFCYMAEYDLWAQKVCHIYTALPVRKHSDPLESHHTALWLSPEEALTQLANSGDRHFLQRVI
ncbi:NUDIX domain-containing protein [Aestuariibius sp. HNIBRBA575]|uniref:NUDIX domain-containing protein n=1 Tax=Aestuariibius sp. HNIBRBA575 TaxID=3233343 RepID=UPI0034A33A34